ncbi:hypothetical protein [Leifsonia sp. WHRI 6310E]|uniref:hypothetical protein n=1 Tax=Leifsonia sp. WHRI 6310E TaxID=3162562 RepID=UPI0032ED3A6A
MDVAALFISIIGALATGAAAIIAWVARADSLKAGRDAAAANERASAAAERATTATEKMAQIQSAIFDGPPWVLSWSVGDTYLLTNNSPVEALSVVFETDPPGLFAEVSEDMPCRIGPRSAISFMWAATFGRGMKKDAVVTWQRPGSEERLEWRHPLPRRPQN